ncbi:hypothetical protein QR680_000112 [Steinernema hermaphroditum]|uniref:Uncharacterized protein n=1 Tax=Steinernema hermaphroditum TaxID=289476 RepID=A0AA39GUZ5_9BILA|nr:hypothetical protein QR680_000112 [Steinernema hermaphroditum]
MIGSRAKEVLWPAAAQKQLRVHSLHRRKQQNTAERLPVRRGGDVIAPQQRRPKRAYVSWRSPIDERVRRRLLSAVDSANVSRRVGGARFVYRITCDQNQAILQRV